MGNDPRPPRHNENASVKARIRLNHGLPYGGSLRTCPPNLKQNTSREGCVLASAASPLTGVIFESAFPALMKTRPFRRVFVKSTPGTNPQNNFITAPPARAKRAAGRKLKTTMTTAVAAVVKLSQDSA